MLGGFISGPWLSSRFQNPFYKGFGILLDFLMAPSGLALALFDRSIPPRLFLRVALRQKVASNLDGRQRCRSTGTDIKSLALRIAQEYEEATRQKKTLRQIQRTLESLREEISGEVTPRATLRQVTEGWLATKRPETAAGTQDFYTVSVKKLSNSLAQKADLPIAEITRADLIRYRNSMGGLAARTVNQHLKVVRMIFKLARKDGLIADDPAEFVDPIKVKAESQAKRPFRLEELRALLDVADPEWKSMILFGLYTGQRLGDVARLTWANIDQTKSVIRLTTQKTGKSLIIPLAESLARHVEGLPCSDDPHTPLHPKAFGFLETHGRTDGLSSQFTDLLAQAGLRKKPSHTSKGAGARQDLAVLSFHSLRHTATTLLHEGGVPAAVAQALIGHDSEAIHQHYIGVGLEALKKAADSFPDVL
jgi:integrase